MFIIFLHWAFIFCDFQPHISRLLRDNLLDSIIAGKKNSKNLLMNLNSRLIYAKHRCLTWAQDALIGFNMSWCWSWGSDTSETWELTVNERVFFSLLKECKFCCPLKWILINCETILQWRRDISFVFCGKKKTILKRECKRERIKKSLINSRFEWTS